MSSQAVDLSVIIPARNAAHVIRDQLEALSRQEFDGSWEIVVVDDRSEDGTGEVARGYSDRLPHVTVVRTERSLNAAHARNVGVSAARGRMLLFTDSDDVVSDVWVRSMARALADEDVVAGRLEVARLNRPWVRVSRPVTQQHALQTWDVGGMPWLLHAGGPNLGVSRRMWEEVGPFDVHLDFVDDIDFCFRAQLAGFELHFVPDAVVHYRLRDSLKGIYRQARDWGRASVDLQRKYISAGMPRPSPAREALSWGRVPLELVQVRGRGDLGLWLHRLGWRVGRLRAATAGLRRRVHDLFRRRTGPPSVRH
jgi:glycosyltransferase involved in cell wall biosynthesis